MRLMGLLLVYLTCFLGGRYMAEKEKQRIFCIEALLLLVREVRRSISFSMIPLEEIYKRYDDNALAKCGFLTLLRTDGLLSAYVQKSDVFRLDSFSDLRFKVFAERVGKHPAEEEIRGCDEIDDLLSNTLEQIKKDYPVKQKLYTALGGCLGIGAVILLL